MPGRAAATAATLAVAAPLTKDSTVPQPSTRSTGFFHADPHPGNLIRTPDGRLAILDFGLMTQVGFGFWVGGGGWGVGGGHACIQYKLDDPPRAAIQPLPHR